MLKNVYWQSLFVAIGATGISYLIGLSAGWVTTLNWLEVFAVFTSYAATYLCVKQKRFNYPLGVVSSAAYALLFYKAGLIASTVLSAYLALALAYGWYRWRPDSKTLRVTRVEARWVPAYLLTTAAFYAGAYFLVTGLGGKLAPLDALILVFTILAQFLLDNKKIETWIVWVVVNVLAIYVYFTSNLYLVGVQYVFFLVNTIYGFTQWRASMKAQEPASPFYEMPEEPTDSEWDKFEAMLDRGTAK